MVAELLVTVLALIVHLVDLYFPEIVASIGVLSAASVGARWRRHRRALQQRRVDRWRRLVRKMFRIRSLRRVWGHLGRFLNDRKQWPRLEG